MYRHLIPAAGMFALAAGPAVAQGNAESASFVLNTLFITFSAILVMWMTAGFTMLEVGFVRAKNVANQCAKNLGLVAVSCVAFLTIGYTLMFPAGNWLISGFLGFGGFVDLGGVATDASDVVQGQAAHGASVFFQMMFCAAAASIVSGALAERMRLLPFFLFVAILTAIIYPIQASWNWGGGMLANQLGFQDLAGGTVVHVVGGVAALTGAMIVGSRSGRYQNGMAMPMPGSNLPLATLGGLMLWMGWFGFNAGSYFVFSTEADAANISRILLNTNMAAAGGIIGAALLSYIKYRQVDLTFMINGALAGLVSITAEPLYPSPIFAVTVGAVGGAIVVLSVTLLDKLKIDDVVGAIPVHLFCGIWGTLAVVLSNPNATIFGQVASIGLVIAFVFITTTIAWTVLNKTIGIRVSAESEANGIDICDMGQEAYPEFAPQ